MIRFIRDPQPPANLLYRQGMVRALTPAEEAAFIASGDAVDFIEPGRLFPPPVQLLPPGAQPSNPQGGVVVPTANTNLSPTAQGFSPNALALNAAGNLVRASADGLSWSSVSGDGFDQNFVIGGQSNADGRGAIDASAEPSNPAVLLYTKGGGVEVCAEPAGKQDAGWVNNTPGGIGPTTPGHSMLTAFAKEVVRLTGVRPIMVPCAIGSTAFSHWVPPAVERDMTTLFGQMQVRAEQTMRAGRQPVFLWYGHEANAGATTLDLATGALGTSYMSLWRAHCDAIRARFPDAWMIYCQLSAGPDAAFAANHLRTGEAQRRAEAGTGDFSTVVGYGATYLPPPSQATLSTNATNTITFDPANPYRFAMVGDGSTPLEGRVIVLTPGVTYRMVVAVSGTGTWQVLASATQIGAAARPVGVVTVDFTADGSGRVRFVRGSGATNLTIEVLSVQVAQLPADSRSIMVVTHDVPRNASPDGLHVAGAGQRIIGRRAARAYAARVLGDPSINGTGPRLVSCTKSGADVAVKFDRVIQADANGYGASLATSLFRVYLNGAEQTLTACARDGSDTTAVRITCAATLTGTAVVTYGDRAGPATSITRPGCVYDADGMPAPMMAVVAS